MNPIFLTLDDILESHLEQIANYDGSLGVRDTGLLQSALAQPGAQFGGQYLHSALFEMASAICTTSSRTTRYRRQQASRTRSRTVVLGDQRYRDERHG